MLRSFRLGTAFGIPLYVHSTFLLLPLFALAMSWAAGPAGVLFSQAVLLTIFACVLLHELGHALMARLFGIPTRDITLYPIGGVARLDSTGHRPHEEIAIALAGPAVNLGIALLLSPVVAALALAGAAVGPDAVLHGAGPLHLFATYLTMVWVGNLVLMAFNLIPAFPMDGGRVLRAFLSLGLGQLRATEVAAAVGLVLAVLLGVAGLFQGVPSLVLVAVFVAVVGQLELHALRQRQARERLRAEAEPVVEVLAPVRIPPGLGGFTGLVWDQHNQVWVRWVNGRPVEVR
jgi:Zn-dependent protease